MADPVLRRIVLFLDGTWNTNDGSNPPTNIVRLHEALKIGVDACETIQVVPSPGSTANGSVIKGRMGPTEYVVHYDSGVGTGAFDRLSGGVIGEGLDDNIRQAYRFLSKHYRPGDEIHLFGFSRGAFTARSVVGYLFATGLLQAEHCTSEYEEKAWKHYRTSPNDRHCGDWYELKPFMQPADTLKIRSLGVFDTVGALGIPSGFLQKINAQRFSFHNTELSSIVEDSFHAVAIDEHRIAFEAALWHTPKFKKYSDANVEQVWFPGAHADIGGGYSNWDSVKDRTGRQDIAYDWMRRRLIDRVRLDFAAPGSSTARAVDCDAKAVSASSIHRPWGVLDSVRHQACRAINQTDPLPSKGVPVDGRGIKTVGLRPHEEPIGEMIHISALALLDSEVRVEWENVRGTHIYRSPNLMAVLPLIAFTYRDWNPTFWTAWKLLADELARGAETPRTLQVIDWDGTPVPSDPMKAKTGTPDPYTYLGGVPTVFGLSPAANAQAAKPGHGS